MQSTTRFNLFNFNSVYFGDISLKLTLV